MMARTMKSVGPLLVAATLALAMMTTGCSTERHTRTVEFTHWHDEDTLVLVYTRQQTAGTKSGIFRSEPRTTHVRVCTVQEDNSMQCRHQRQLVNMLNPYLVDRTDLDDRWRR